MNPFVDGGIIEMDSDDLQVNFRIAKRNTETLKQIDKGVPFDELTYHQMPKDRGPTVSRDKSTELFVNLYKGIKKKGWVNEPLINISIEKDGYMRTRRGRHRSSILQHLGNRKIKVLLTCAPEFVKFCDKLFNMSTKREGRVYQRIDMPYFKYIPTYDGQDRIKYILFNIDFDGLSVLDIGCRMGRYSHYPAKHGANVVGIDIASIWKELCQYLTTVYEIAWDKHLHVQFFNCDVYKFYEQDDIEFDVVMYLSVYHHLCVGNRKNANLLLKKMSNNCTAMVFDAGKQWQNKYGIKDVPKEIIKQSAFTKYKQIANAGDGDLRRNLFIFWKGNPKWIISNR